MRRAAAALIVFAGNVAAHPGHSGQEGHFHGWGLEHALLLLMILGALAFAMKNK